MKPQLTPEEVAISHRFVQLRRLLGKTQGEFATALGFTIDCIVAVDNLRTALKVGLALHSAEKFQVNIGWLATGLGPVFTGSGPGLLPVQLDYRHILLGCGTSASLAASYQDFFAPAVDAAMKATFPSGEGRAAVHLMQVELHNWVEAYKDNWWLLLATMHQLRRTNTLLP